MTFLQLAPYLEQNPFNTYAVLCTAILLEQDKVEASRLFSRISEIALSGNPCAANPPRKPELGWLLLAQAPPRARPLRGDQL